jgi:putative endonuclease
MFVVYVIYNNQAAKMYVGQTSDLVKRLKEHNEHKFSHSYTARFSGEWKLIYKEEFSTRKEALSREKQLKSYKGREFLRKYIPR